MTTLREIVENYNNEEVMREAAIALVRISKPVLIKTARRGCCETIAGVPIEDSSIVLPKDGGEICVDVDGLGPITVGFEVRSDEVIITFNW